jgi:hypothetical protein
MDITTKIKTKIGGHEFEAEGPVDIVNAQFEAFRQLISTMPRTGAVSSGSEAVNSKQNQVDTVGNKHLDIAKVMHVSGRIVSLTALPQSIEDAALLILLGHKDLRNNVAVTGQEVGDGLAQSGRPVARVDRVMERAITEAYVLKSGIKRSTRYRLTNQGLVKALNIAKALVESLP